MMDASAGRWTAGAAGALIGLFSAVQTSSKQYVISTPSDTVAIERVTRAGNTLTGDMRLVAGKTSLHYVLHLRPDGSAESADIVNEASGFFTGTIAFGGAAASLAQQGRGVAGQLTTAPADMLPVIGISMGLIDYIIGLHPPKLGETVQLSVLNIRNRFKGSLSLKRFSPDSLLVDCDGCMQPRSTEELRVGLTRDGAVAGGTRVETHWTMSVQH